MTKVRVTAVLVAATVFQALAIVGSTRADSAIDLLGKFDAARLQAAYPPSDKKTFEELAKLIYRIGRVDRSSFVSRVTADAKLVVGDAAMVTGEIQSMRNLRVPEELVDVLEFSLIQDLVLKTDDATSVNVIAPRLPTDAKVGDQVEAVGVVIDVGEASAAALWPQAMASAKLKWFPAKPPSSGWRLLSEAGVDVSGLAEVATRNRQRLMAADNDPFYQILAVSEEVGRTPLAAELQPTWVKPVDLLREPNRFTGEWMRMRLRTVRVTKVAVTDLERQKQLGSDHYYQVDANGDLENVVIKIQRAPGESGGPVLFEGTYPVSLVMKDLPTFLSDAIRAQEGGDAVVSMISKPIQVDGFFFRLWSYSSDFMERQGAGNQFGPLVMVAGVTDRSSVGENGVGVEIIGYIAAIGIVTGLLAALLWTRRNSGEDREVREKRQSREAERLNLPE